MVFQRPNPLPISVYENIIFGLRSHSPNSSLKDLNLDEIVESSLKEVQLWEATIDSKEKATSIDQSSSKNCIARLLPLKPEVILTDSLCHSDADGIENLMSSYQSCQKKRFTIIIVTAIRDKPSVLVMSAFICN